MNDLTCECNELRRKLLMEAKSKKKVIERSEEIRTCMVELEAKLALARAMLVNVHETSSSTRLKRLAAETLSQTSMMF